ncbi:ribonuclease Z [Flavobacterium sp.]|uniref:ribonuclease Z n=1 Tax=Flavobacterium sp. TaxID=239 RepID=UPI00262F885B|nr:ribonuclease Z [Flavobacterium sp.]MDD3005182.1 ribonuclease Z [Flavobacterium sp.]
MKVTVKEKTTILKDTKVDLVAFIAQLTSEINKFKTQNLIVDLSNHGAVEKEDVLLFQSISKMHKANKKSFVIVVSETDFNDFPDDFVVVPTLLEAHDIIEMEEIERDLGF